MELKKGLSLMKLGRPDGAREEFRQVVERYPTPSFRGMVRPWRFIGHSLLCGFILIPLQSPGTD